MIYLSLLFPIAAILMSIATFRIHLRTNRINIKTWESLASTAQMQIDRGYGDPEDLTEAHRWLRSLRRHAPVLRVLSFDWLWRVK